MLNSELMRKGIRREYIDKAISELVVEENIMGRVAEKQAPRYRQEDFWGFKENDSVFSSSSFWI